MTLVDLNYSRLTTRVNWFIFISESHRKSVDDWVFSLVASKLRGQTNIRLSFFLIAITHLVANLQWFDFSH